MPKPSVSALNDRLFAALEQSDEAMALEGLMGALKEGADPNAVRRHAWEPSDSSVLEVAVSLDEPWAGRLALALLDAGANPMLRKGSAPALVIAARYGRLETVEALLSRGHSAKAVTPQGWTPFLCAAAQGKFELCERLAPISNVLAHADDGCAEMRVDAAFLFIKNKMPKEALLAYKRGWGDPGRMGNSYWTPLIHAVQEQFDDLVAYLAERPESERVLPDVAKRTALHYAVLAGKNGAGGRPDYVQALSRAGHDLNALDEDGASALTMAFLRRCPECAKALLEAGADPSARLLDRDQASGENQSVWGMDALCAAVSSNKPWALELGLGFAERCDRSAVAFDMGHTALHCAATLKDARLAEEWTRALLDLGWDPMALDGYDQTPLMLAMSAQNSGVMGLLIPKTDLSHQSKAGLDAFGVGEWLASARSKPDALAMLRAHLDRAALAEEIAPAGTSSSSKPRGI